MTAIITEKPSVGKDIARILGATKDNGGYMSGNGYMVTWAYGHLLTPALPFHYGYLNISAEDLPIIPDPFKLIVRSKKTVKSISTDVGAERQLKIIGKVFDSCDDIIVATDAGREGELIFRFIFSYLNCQKPFRRLWINSLTDAAIKTGFANLKDGKLYDNLYHAADCRAKADWLIGINASRALRIASGKDNNSLGRVQTPTLAMICSRYQEHINFTPKDYWQLKITLQKDGQLCHFSATSDIIDRHEATENYNRLKTCTQAKIVSTEIKTICEQPPLLYDLTELQKDASNIFSFSAERTLEIAQKLYEKKLISYPRTGSGYIPEDVFEQMPKLIASIKIPEELAAYAREMYSENLNPKSVNAKKVTDHHALIITGIMPVCLNQNEQTIYNMVAGRMLEAFSPECEKEIHVVRACCDDFIFESRTTQIKIKGWRGVFNRTEDKEEDEQTMPEFVADEIIPIASYNLLQRKPPQNHF